MVCDTFQGEEGPVTRFIILIIEIICQHLSLKGALSQAVRPRSGFCCGCQAISKVKML